RRFNSVSNEVTRRIYDLRFTIYEPKDRRRANRKSEITNSFRQNRPLAVNHRRADLAGKIHDGFMDFGNVSFEWDRNEIGKSIPGQSANFSGHAEGAR